MFRRKVILKQMIKKALAYLLAFIMVFSLSFTLLPTKALAEGPAVSAVIDPAAAAFDKYTQPGGCNYEHNME